MSKLKVLDFDIENRPLAYLGPDFTTAEITAIAAGFSPDLIFVWLLGINSYEDMLQGFCSLYDQADIVTGHYIRGHDLPVINGAMVETGLAPLTDKLTSDTKLDFIKSRYLSESQENLSAALKIEAEKVHMSNAKWREANRLTPAGLQLTKDRVVGDVIEHMELRKEMVARRLLGAPKVWRSR